MRVGIAGAYLGERSASDGWRLIGLEPIKWAVEVGAFIDFWPAEFLRTRLELRRGVRGHDGFVAALGADAVHRLGPFTLSVGPRLKFADERFTQTYFGVRPHESAANGFLPPYRTGAGVAAVGALASLGYAWSQDWSTMVYTSYYNLVGDAAASPIMRRIGSTDQFGFGASFSYSYGVDMARSAAAGYFNSMMDPGEPRWGIALLGGASAGEDRLVNLLGNPWIARFREDFFGGVAVSRRIGRWFEHFMVDIEGGAGYRHGRTNAPEGWVAAYLRFDGFPWSQIVYTTVGVSTGVNYIARLPAVELGTIRRPEPSTSKLLHYFSPEITFSHPAYRSHELLIRYHHRSGVFGLFGGVWGGSNVIAMGYRNRF